MSCMHYIFTFNKRAGFCVNLTTVFIYIVDLIDPSTSNSFKEMHVFCATITHCALYSTLTIASNLRDCAIVLADKSAITYSIATAIMFSLIMR